MFDNDSDVKLLYNNKSCRVVAVSVLQSVHFMSLPTLTMSVGRIFESVCLSVCWQHNSKTNDP